MAKPKGNPGVQNRAIYSRASYLYQAAAYLACRAHQVDAEGPSPDKAALQKGREDKKNAQSSGERQRKQLRNLSRHAISEMRAVTLKTQIRQSQALKRTVCKFCDTLQLEAQTCRSTIENPSKGGLKPWADVLVVRCETCGNVKRFPVSASRQKRKSLRSPKFQKPAKKAGPSNSE